MAAETNKQGESEHADSIIVGTGREKIRIPVLYLPGRALPYPRTARNDTVAAELQEQADGRIPHACTRLLLAAEHPAALLLSSYALPSHHHYVLSLVLSCPTSIRSVCAHGLRELLF
jgi:hypothetical protein